MREKAGTQWREKDIVFCNLYGDYLTQTCLVGQALRLIEVVSSYTAIIKLRIS